METFEGTEKKLMVTIAGEEDLRNCDWNEIVDECEACILKKLTNKDVDAYILSESSLFVWSHSFFLITGCEGFCFIIYSTKL